MPKGGKEKEMSTLFDNGSSTESLDNSEPCLSAEMSIFLSKLDIVLRLVESLTFAVGRRAVYIFSSFLLLFLLWSG